MTILKILRFILINIAVVFLAVFTNLFALSGWDESPALLPNMTTADPNELIEGLSGDDTVAILEDEVLSLEDAPVYEEGILYVPISFVKSHFNDDFYWDSDEKVLTYTTIKDVIRMKSDDLTYFVNSEPLTLSIPIRELKEGVAYMPLELLKKFSHHEFYHDEALDTLVIEDLSKDAVYVTISDEMKDGAYIRSWKDQLSPVVKSVNSEDQLKIYGDDGIWVLVRTAEGLKGYIKKSELGSQVTVAGVERVREIYDYSTQMTFEGKLNLGWHQVYNTTANNTLDSRLEGVHGLDVISPFWFRLENSEGDINNIADINYVRKAHNQGLQVWAMFTNNFDKTITHDVLSSTSKRESVIKDILALASLYELDGINVDFENVAKDDGVYFVQFMKELTPYLKKQGLVVSVDMYVPRPWTAHYGREEVGEIVDYVMIMAYDEHWATSPESGSVASIEFVEDGIVQTLKEVPKEKIILGLPYYTRLWFEKEENGETKVSSKAYGMDKAKQIMDDNNVELEWLDGDIKQYYGEYSDDEYTYKMWLEEERSIEEKVKLVEKYELAGVAGWSLVFPKEEIWDVLKTYLKE